MSHQSSPDHRHTFLTLARKERHERWHAESQKLVVETLADTRSVSDAAAYAQMSVPSGVPRSPSRHSRERGNKGFQRFRIGRLTSHIHPRFREDDEGARPKRGADLTILNVIAAALNQRETARSEINLPNVWRQTAVHEDSGFSKEALPGEADYD